MPTNGFTRKTIYDTIKEHVDMENSLSGLQEITGELPIRWKTIGRTAGGLFGWGKYPPANSINGEQKSIVKLQELIAVYIGRKEKRYKEYDGLRFGYVDGKATAIGQRRKELTGMILNTGSRTDIPAYYSKWFYKRLEEGYVLVRNPYYPSQVTKYILRPEVIDAVVFCTKNPAPMLGQISRLAAYDTFWFVTVTPYGKDIEPFVPDKNKVLQSFQALSGRVGAGRMSWRYDPILITEKYSVDMHTSRFRKMAKMLRGYTGQCVISFIDLYGKTKRNFPDARCVTGGEQKTLIDAMGTIAAQNGMQVHLCCENSALAGGNVDAGGCLSKEVLEQAIGCRLDVPKKKTAREACSCLLGADIGAYNTCGHGCLYCYANEDRQAVLQNMKRHDADSPMLVGTVRAEDVVKVAEQKSWRNGQMSIFDMLAL